VARGVLTKILLAEISENIVIFIDEIDSVLSLNFPTDDFFAFIRSCYNERVDNPQYNRLTFCLLGVASPTSLIQNKNRTPFNIGQAISLKGFQLHEVEPLEKGLFSKFNNPHAIMQEILQWTGGQPFLTQKLCQFMVEESAQEHPRSVEQVVRSRIIESWESQDEPEHLRTIQARILRDEQRAGYLLELYQQVRLAQERSQVIADETLEQSELQLSGLVVRQQGHLRIYNQIYREIFNLNWIEIQLNNLRPYSENFRFWVASGETDESRLLRGKALQEAEEWAKDKNLSYQDKQFLAASKEKEIQEEIAAKEQEAALERERKDREAAEERNQLLSEANKKAQQRISVGVVVLVVAVLGAVGLGIFSSKQVEVANQAKEELKSARKQTQDAKESEKNAKNSAAQAKHQEQQAKENEGIVKQEADRTVKQAQKQVDNAKGIALKFEKDAATARQYLYKAQDDLENKNRELSKTNSQLNQAKNQELKILAALKVKENELNKTNAKNKEAQDEVINVRQLVALAGQLRNQSSSNSDEALRLAAVSFNIDNHELKQALLLSAKSQVSQQLKDWNKAKNEIEQSQLKLSKAAPIDLSSSQGLQVQVLVQKIQGDLLSQNQQNQIAIEYYNKAFKILKTHPSETDSTKDNQLLTGENIESVYRSLRKLNPQNKEFEASLTEHLYAQLEYFLKAENWEAADRETDKLMLNISKAENKIFLGFEQINNFSCPDLRRIDQLWVSNSDNRFGFSVQKQIWINTMNRLGITLAEWTDNEWTYKDEANYVEFAKQVGWYNERQQEGSSRGSWVSYSELINGIKENPGRYRGGLPGVNIFNKYLEDSLLYRVWQINTTLDTIKPSYSLALRLVKCNI